jgi:uncharacterized membrane protein
VTVTATLYQWLLLLHIVAAMVWVGGGIVLGALATIALRVADADAAARFVRVLPVVGPRVLAPATVAVVGLGVWMVLNSAAWDFGELWVQLALGLFAAAFAIGAVYQSRAALRAQRAVEAGDVEEMRRQLARWSWGYCFIVVLLLVAAWDMVFKPGL